MRASRNDAAAPAVSSEDASSTMTSSQSACVCARTLRTARPRVCARSRVGVTSVTVEMMDASADRVRRIRVLYFVSSFEQGGAERQVAELVRGLPRDRFEPHLAVCNPRNDLGYDLGVASSLDLRAPRGPDARTFLSLLSHVRAFRPD